MAATEKPHVRGKLAIEGVGFVEELESFTVRFEGDPEDLEALEGTVGQLMPKGVKAIYSGTLFVPSQRDAYSQLLDAWNTGKRLTCIAFMGGGTVKVTGKGRMNAPEFTDDGAKMNFEVRCAAPKLQFV